MDLGMFYVNSDGELDMLGITHVTVDTLTQVVTGRIPHISSIAIAPKWAAPALLGDFDRNLVIDFIDFSQLVFHFNSNHPSGDLVGEEDSINLTDALPWFRGDFHPNGTIDFEDIAAFAMMYNWHQSEGSYELAKPVVTVKQTPTLIATGLNWNSENYEVGETFIVSLNIVNMSDFLGANAVLAFDSEILRVKNVTSGIASDIRNVSAPVLYRTSPGSLTAYTVALGNIRNGLSISGENLFNIEFEVIGEGTFSIQLSGLEMRDFRNSPVTVEIDIDLITGKAEDSVNTTPLAFGLSQNYPNPFNMSTIITYNLEKAGEVEIVIYNSLGQEIRQLENDSHEPGKYSVMWNGTDDKGSRVTSGVYFVRMRQANRTDTMQMMLVK